MEKIVFPNKFSENFSCLIFNFEIFRLVKMYELRSLILALVAMFFVFRLNSKTQKTTVIVQRVEKSKDYSATEMIYFLSLSLRTQFFIQEFLSY